MAISHCTYSRAVAISIEFMETRNKDCQSAIHMIAALLAGEIFVLMNCNNLHCHTELKATIRTKYIYDQMKK